MGLSLTVFELSRFEVWPHFLRAARDPPPPPETENYILADSRSLRVHSRFGFGR